MPSLQDGRRNCTPPPCHLPSPQATKVPISSSTQKGLQKHLETACHTKSDPARPEVLSRHRPLPSLYQLTDRHIHDKYPRHTISLTYLYISSALYAYIQRTSCEGDAQRPQAH